MMLRGMLMRAKRLTAWRETLWEGKVVEYKAGGKTGRKMKGKRWENYDNHTRTLYIPHTCAHSGAASFITLRWTRGPRMPLMKRLDVPLSRQAQEEAM